MALPFFYSENITTGLKDYVLNEESSRHIVQVLRMKEGEMLHVTNGKGYLFSTEISEAGKKAVAVKILDNTFTERSREMCIAISPVKNTARFEWFLEKSTEIGITEIIPVVCKRTEKQNFRLDRMKNIMVSAMLQSKQTWLPVLTEPVKYEKFLSRDTPGHKFIAHCSEGNKVNLVSRVTSGDTMILIGPEGDFNSEEISMAVKHGFSPVSLGNTRLRTETAGIVAAVILANFSLD